MPTKRQNYHAHFKDGCHDETDRAICDLWANGLPDVKIATALKINRGDVYRRRFQIIERVTVSFPTLEERMSRVVDRDAVACAMGWR